MKRTNSGREGGGDINISVFKIIVSLVMLMKMDSDTRELVASHT